MNAPHHETTAYTDCREAKLLIVGLGNTLLRDDGIGVRTVRALQVKGYSKALVVEVGTAVLDALHLFEWADKVIAIDSMVGGGPPGTIYMCDIETMADPDQPVSLHQLTLIESLRFIPKAARPNVTILGVEPEVIDYGLDLSPGVEEAVPRLIEIIERLTAAWGKETAFHSNSTEEGSRAEGPEGESRPLPTALLPVAEDAGPCGEPE